ncbi:MAG: hypothetical protein OHK0022_38200 [Roseiflexaceae bacterium]
MNEPPPCTPPPRRPTLAGLEHCWARGLMSNEELLGCLLRYLVQQEKKRIHEGHEGPEIEELKTQNAILNTELAELKTQNSKLKTQLLGLSRLLWQVGEAVDVLGGEELDIWQEGGRWYWRWQDTSSVAPRPLRSHGDALVDAVEHRAGLLAPPE